MAQRQFIPIQCKIRPRHDLFLLTHLQVRPDEVHFMITLALEKSWLIGEPKFLMMSNWMLRVAHNSRLRYNPDNDWECLVGQRHNLIFEEKTEQDMHNMIPPVFEVIPLVLFLRCCCRELETRVKRRMGRGIDKTELITQQLSRVQRVTQFAGLRLNHAVYWIGKISVRILGAWRTSFPCSIELNHPATQDLRVWSSSLGDSVIGK